MADRRWIVQGRTGRYIVWRHGDVPPDEDTWTCTCKGYHFTSRHRYRFHCRHIQAIRAEIIAHFKESLG